MCNFPLLGSVPYYSSQVPVRDISRLSDRHAWLSITAYCKQKVSHPQLSTYFICTTSQVLQFPLLRQLFQEVNSHYESNSTVMFFDPPHSTIPIAELKALKGGTFMYICNVKFGNHTLRAMLDTGATHSLIATKSFQRCKMLLSRDTDIPIVQAANGSTLQVRGVVRGDLCIHTYCSTNVPLQVLDMNVSGVDIILGMDWMAKHNCRLDTSQGTATLGFKRKQVLLPRKLFVNDDCGNVKPIPFINSAKKLRRFMSKNYRKDGCKFVVLFVRKQGTSCVVTQPTSMGIAPCPLDQAPNLKQVPDRLRALLKKYAHIFQPLEAGVKNKYQYQQEVIPTEPHVPPFKPMYRLSQAELEEMTKQIQHFLQMGWIRPSDSPYGAPILFAVKADGSLRMCIDYRQLNKITIKNKYPLPNIADLIDMLQGAQYFTSIDLLAGYHQIALRESDIPKTAFRTPLGHFECLVLWEGLTNAPSVFQSIMYRLLSPFVGKFVCLYIDDILIFSRTEEEHYDHIERVLKVLSDNNLKAKLQKCQWMQRQTKFLGWVVSRDGISPDPSKIKAILDFPRPTNTSDLRRFNGMCNFFRKFIYKFSHVMKPLTEKQNAPSPWGPNDWTPEMQSAFDTMKKLLTSTPVLALPDFKKQFEVMADASGIGCGAVLLQDTRPVAFFSKAFNDTERKMITSDQELAAIIYALKEWRCYLEGPEFILKTDHEPLTFFETVAQLSRKKTTWLEFLSRFKYKWVHIPGKSNVVADALSRIHSWNQKQVESVVAHVAYVCSLLAPIQQLPQPDDDEEFRELYGDPSTNLHDVLDSQLLDDELNPLIAHILLSYSEDPAFQVKSDYKKTKAGLYIQNNRIVVGEYYPVIEFIMSSAHDDSLYGHKGFDKTYETIRKDFTWNKMYSDIKHYCETCKVCQTSKSRTAKEQGLLQPLQLPTRKWGSISMDFICNLPKTRKHYTAILVVVDRFTKMIRLFPCKRVLNSQELADIIYNEIVKHYGLPYEIITDRGTQFVSDFTRDLWAHFDTKLKPSTAYRPQTDGQTERMNRMLHEYIRNYIGNSHTDWDRHLVGAEFAHNQSYCKAIGTTPFFLMYGYHPATPLTLNLRDHKPHSAKLIAKQMERQFKLAKKCLMAAQHRMKASYDKHHRDKTFNIGDLVWLSSKNIALQGFSKFLPKYLGPFAVTKAYGTHAYKLALPSGWSIHDVFHISLLKAYKSREGFQGQLPHVPILLTNYVVDRIIDHDIIKRGRRTIIYYKLRYKDLDADSDTWEDEKRLMKHYPELISQYKRDHHI